VSKPKYVVRLLRVAEDDLNDIVTYIAAENPIAAEVIAAKIERNLLYLSTHHFIGRVPDEEELARLGYRYLIVQDYLIFYTIEGQTILVHRIIHGARDYLRLLKN
jgi:toxin ParE1/3/4